MSLISGGAAIDEAIARDGELPLPPYISAATPDAADASATRPSSRARRARSPRPPPGCTSRPSCSRADGARHRRGAVTLHVGPGTFLPVARRRPRRPRRCTRERYEIPEATAARHRPRHARRPAGRRGRHHGRAHARVRRRREGRARRAPAPARPRLFIPPGYRFRVVDACSPTSTCPRSTLLMLVSRLRRPRARSLAAYAEAVAARLPLLQLRRRDAHRRDVEPTQLTIRLRLASTLDAGTRRTRAPARCTPRTATSRRRCSCPSAPRAPSRR